MKLKLKKSVLFLLLLSSSISYGQNIAGNWTYVYEPDSVNTVFSLKLFQDKKTKLYKGEYLNVTQYGRFIDEGDAKVTSWNGKKGKIKITDTGGRAYPPPPALYTIELINDTTLSLCCPTPLTYNIHENMILIKTMSEEEALKRRRSY